MGGESNYRTSDWTYGSASAMEVAARTVDSSGTRMPKKVSDSLLEQRWSGIVKVGEQERNVFEYYDYYFTGEDIQI